MPLCGGRAVPRNRPAEALSRSRCPWAAQLATWTRAKRLGGLASRRECQGNRRGCPGSFHIDAKRRAAAPQDRLPSLPLQNCVATFALSRLVEVDPQPPLPEPASSAESPAVAGRRHRPPAQSSGALLSAAKAGRPEAPERNGRNVGDDFERAERVGSYLSNPDANKLLTDIDFGRRQPWLALAGRIALGVVSARLLKASSSSQPSEPLVGADPG